MNTKVKPVDALTEVDRTEVMPSSRAGSDSGELSAGSEIGHYVIESLLGEGGGGIVYSARHRVLGRRVALKVLRAEMATFPGMLTRFMREAEAVNRIAHPNIVDIYEFRELSPGRPYYVMELLEGRDLRTVLEEHGRLSPALALELLEPICRAVQAAHDAGIVHRDIKASNVFIAERNGERVIKLLDFGIAKSMGGDAAGQGLTEPGARLGTAHNMAPEQVRGDKVDARADIYALGVVIYQLLTGQYPFQGSDPRQVALLHLTAPAPRPSALAPVCAAIDAVVLRCMEKQAERRYGSAMELLAAFTQAVHQVAAEIEETTRRAVGVYIEAVVGDEDLEDEAYEDLTCALESLELALAEHGFELVLRTASGHLHARIDEGSGQAEAEQLARQLLASVAQREGAHPTVRISASVHTGELIYRGGEVGGGSLLKVRTWAEQHRIPAD
jgi:serine/threonine-protein kinase